ncbi:hypothetical protein vseg_014681 [Gypsophila vaccaria]
MDRKHEDQCKESKTVINLDELQGQNSHLLAEIQSLKQVNEDLELKGRKAEETVVNLRLDFDDALENNMEVLIQRDFMKSQISVVQERVREKEAELSRKFGEGVVENECFEMLRLSKESLMRVCMGLGVKESSFEWELGEWKEMKNLFDGLDFVLRMSRMVEEKLSDYGQEKEDMLKEIEVCKRRYNDLLEGVNVSLVRISDGFKVENVEYQGREELSGFEDGLDLVAGMVKRVECELDEYKEKVRKDTRELESSVLSLTEENRDINALLRIALVEKEALEKSLMKLKGSSGEQKRMPLLQFAGRSLQSIGFGFMMGGAAYDEDEMQEKDGDQCSDNLTSDLSVASDFSSECEEEVVSLASAVETLVKKLRLEITHLRKALDESRLDSERLQNLIEKQAQQITEQTTYIKELEDQNRTLTQNVMELLTEIKTAEEDADRWKEACELEVEAGKRVIQERDKVVAILTQELEKTRAALQASHTKIKMKEELAQAAMAAQLAAERSLQLADSRAVVFRERIEALTLQLEADSRDKNGRIKVSRICWPWQAFKLATPANTSNRTRIQHSAVRQMPEMQALFQSV